MKHKIRAILYAKQAQNYMLSCWGRIIIKMPITIGKKREIKQN